MSKHYRYFFTLLILVILSAGIVGYALHNSVETGLFSFAERNINQYSSIDRPPKIRPLYSGIVIPPNIAPLNFLLEESGSQYCVKIHSKKGGTIQIFSRSPKIMIPQGQWHELLNANRGEKLNFDVYLKTAKPPTAKAQQPLSIVICMDTEQGSFKVLPVQRSNLKYSGSFGIAKIFRSVPIG